MQKGLRVITLQGAIEKSPILLSQYWKNQWFDGNIIISYFDGSNNIVISFSTYKHKYLDIQTCTIFIQSVPKNMEFKRFTKISYIACNFFLDFYKRFKLRKINPFQKKSHAIFLFVYGCFCVIWSDIRLIQGS